MRAASMSLNNPAFTIAIFPPMSSSTGNLLDLAREIRVKVPYLGLYPEPFLGVYR